MCYKNSMKNKYRNLFLLFGVLAIVVMLCTMDMDYSDIWENLKRVGFWFPVIMLLWFFVYLINTCSWYLIIRDDRKYRVPFWTVCKLSITGFAINYATPGGLMGGEPYRIMSLTPRIGTERASSSVILYAMTHIFSHFWFWLVSIFLFIATQRVTMFMALFLAATGAFCLAAIWFFIKGYKRGITVSCMNLLRRFPLIKRRAQGFFDRHREKLSEIDRQIAALHNQNRRTFVAAVSLELACRIVSALEIYFILLVIMPQASYPQSILILAFTSLIANMLFFMPLQLGGREGGFLMSTNGLALTANAGIFVALIVRIRELIWTAIGLFLIKFDRK